MALPSFQPKMSREFKFGNTTVVIHSQIAWMSKEEQRIWFKNEWKKNNPVLRNIAQAVFDCS